ncbi:hypothetical protein EZV62_022041 [Acer yangbiense]|uniref:Uncharacterized protein n=1 Tax=Acer yangbiense TaxID=1000413 RepID=A0A5C7H8M3_9ROSI|nr:hypothetical protein EZV62_022041 [Acer yangbiense]
MTTPGYYLAEAYVLRKMHKEKMKKIDQEKAKIEGIDLDQGKRSSRSSGCFLWKIRPKRVSSTDYDAAGKLTSNGEMG